MTKEQRSLSQMNKERAQKYFELTGELPKDRGQFEYVLHHVDESLRHEDIERYIQWNPEDLVVMKYAEHSRHHNLGRPKSESTKKKISNTLKGRKQSQETIDKRVEKLKGHPFYGGGAPKGIRWFNNGVINIRTFECPEGFVAGRINYRS